MKILAVCGLFLSQVLAQQPGGTPFCAVRLAVNLADGSPVASASAELIDASGSVILTTRIVNGTGAFCDFGFGLFSIRVTDQQDLPVTLHGVRFDYNEAQRLVVVLNRSTHAGSGGAAGNACRALIRVRSADGSAVPGVKASYGGTFSVGDEFGRLLLLVPIRVSATFRIEKTGFVSQDISLSCGDARESIEREVRLLRDEAAH